MHSDTQRGMSASGAASEVDVSFLKGQSDSFVGVDATIAVIRVVDAAGELVRRTLQDVLHFVRTQMRTNRPDQCRESGHVGRRRAGATESAVQATLMAGKSGQDTVTGRCDRNEIAPWGAGCTTIVAIRTPCRNQAPKIPQD